MYFDSEPVAASANGSGINKVPPKERGRIGMHSYRWGIQ